MKISKLKIIGGTNKGRVISFNPSKSLRPTSHKTRETLFNWLAIYIDDSKCLDLFSGTGALGIEALSRNAKSVTFIENKKLHYIKLKENIDLMSYSKKSKIIFENTFDWLEKLNKQKLDSDIVFIDPPFGEKKIQKVYGILEKKSLLKNDTVIYVEAEKELNIMDICSNWTELKTKISGETKFSLFLKKKE
ncbi:MAG: 16S rRNA (guanine(966)-N(2))-methyltransferase RsmD [SAR86 cluster bacterium]|jgi:16S rRNA (guanine966-N2)-methyltransferase|nr:16S rRNA (guanine(966)-N(2))-methyltransferase RsmD [SAR86 cluster bacterium]